MPDFFGRMVGLMNIEANTNLLNAEAQDQQMLAQQRALQVQQIQQRQQSDALINQTLTDLAAGRRGQQIQGGQVAQSGDPLISKLNEQLQRDTENAQNLRQLAVAMGQQNVPLDVKEKLNKDADSAERVALGTERVLRQEQSDLMKHVGSIAGAAVQANSDDGFRQAYKELVSLDPILAHSLTIDRDTNGIPSWGPKSKAAMEFIENRGMTASEQISRKVQVDDELRKQADEARKKSLEDLNKQKLEAEIAATRALGRKRQKEAEEPPKPSAIAKAADSEPTRGMVQDSKAAVEAFVSEKYPELKKDNSMNAFAVDVADKTNQLRAEAERRGDKLSIEDARQQALEALSPLLKTTPEVKHWLSENEKGKVMYSRTRTSTAKPSTAAPTKPQTADDYLRSIGVSP